MVTERSVLQKENARMEARENSAWYEVERRLAKIAEREGERRKSKRTHLLEDTKVAVGGLTHTASSGILEARDHLEHGQVAYLADYLVHYHVFV